MTEAHSAPQFAAALSSFLQNEGFPSQFTQTNTLLNYAYPMYKKFSRSLSSLRGAGGERFSDTVHARPATKHGPARYSTVLFAEDLNVAETIGVKGMVFIIYFVACQSHEHISCRIPCRSNTGYLQPSA